MAQSPSADGDTPEEVKLRSIEGTASAALSVWCSLCSKLKDAAGGRWVEVVKNAEDEITYYKASGDRSRDEFLCGEHKKIKAGKKPKAPKVPLR